MAGKGFDWTTDHAVKFGAMVAGDELSEGQIAELRDGLVALVTEIAPEAWAKIGVSEARAGSRGWAAVGKKVLLNDE